MLARSLKNIWTDEKLVYLCSAKDKMVSNLTTVLQYCLSSAQWRAFGPSLLSVQLLPVGFVTLWSVIFDTCPYQKGGAPWVGSNLEMWSCPSGYRPSYFVLEGGEEWGGALGSHKLLCSVAPPPARLLRIGGVCALRAVYLTVQLCPVSAFHAHLLLFAFWIWLIMTIVPYGSSTLIPTAWYTLLNNILNYVSLKGLIPKCHKMHQVVSGRQLIICTPPPASDAGLERQNQAQQQRWLLYFRAVEASRYK